jgi:diguanylate cyclase (GGDEF)-like protein
LWQTDPVNTVEHTMAQQADLQAQTAPRHSAVFLSPMAGRRADFRAACEGLFARLETADGAAACAALLDSECPDLLVIDLERFAPSLDLDALAGLVARRAQLDARRGGGPSTLLLCPFATAHWLPLLMQRGPLAYAMTPLAASGTRACVERSLAGLAVPAAVAGEAVRQRRLLDLRAHSQRALDAATDVHEFSQQLCDALCAWPGVLHAAVLHLKPGGDLQLEAQQGKPGLLLGELLGRTDHMLQIPLRHAFPALLAAATGEPALLEAPEQGGEPDLAHKLRSHGVAMAAGWPIPGDGPGPARGALSLLFDAQHAFASDELALLDDLARLAAFGMRLAETTLENETLLARLTHVSTVDALTGVANRRHGEDLLEKEIKRARRYHLPLALVAFDIDRFRAINDAYGYPVGDVALRTVAEATLGVLRASDVLVRSGGEEFHIIAPHTSAIDALRMAEKVRVAIEHTPIPGCDHLTVSLGVAQLGEQESGDSLAQRADAALARAKRAGRNCVELAMQ